MTSPLAAALANPWATLDRIVDGPLHPGGVAATNRLLDRAGVSEGTRVLDVGCGSGHALELAGDRGAMAVGMDRAPDPGRSGADRRFVRGRATVLPVADGIVDVVLAECVLCLAGLDESLGEVRRVLDAGGRLALSDVVADDPPDLPDQLASACCLSSARSRETLRARVERAGFEVEGVRSHRNGLLGMRDDLAGAVDYEGLLGAMGERGRELSEGLAALERAVEDGRVGYVSVVASAP